jgi:HAD superfamily hydrolase (TIGR01509 family)
LVELGGMPDFIKWTGKSQEEIGSIWLGSNAVRDFERGYMSFKDFHGEFVKEWGVDISHDSLHQSFESWVKSAYPGSFDLLDDLSAHYELACLTNTNPVQWPIVHKTIKADRYFKSQYASHVIQKIKPDIEVYAHVVNSLGVQPKNIVFLDDSATNVNAAKEVGLQSFQVKGAQGAREVLVKNGFI